MLTKLHFSITAIVMMAVMLIVIGLSGCATQRSVNEVKAEVRDVKLQNEQTQTMLTRMDSTIAEGALANNRMRADVSMTVDNLQHQIDMLLENYNELLAQIQQLNLQPNIRHVIQSSPGASEPTSVTVKEPPTSIQEPVQPAIDCQETYDESFLLVRRGEYDKAIEGFHSFLKHCQKHASAGDAHYWLGESYYSLERYVDAINEFKYLAENFKEPVNASRAMYKLARSQQELGKIGDAKATFQKLIDEYPESLEASQARERLKDL